MDLGMAQIPAQPMQQQTLNGLAYQLAMGQGPYYDKNYLAAQNAAHATTQQYGGNYANLATHLLDMLLKGGHSGTVAERNFGVGQDMQRMMLPEEPYSKPLGIPFPEYLNPESRPTFGPVGLPAKGLNIPSPHYGNYR
jgi:hypothetical protein